MKNYISLLKTNLASIPISSLVKGTILSSVAFVTPVALAYPDISSPYSHNFVPPSDSRPDTVALSTTGTRFRPPSNPRPRSGSLTTKGTRTGRCLGEDGALDLLGPKTVLGQTIQGRPEFVWHLPPVEASFPVTFRLLVVNEDNTATEIYTHELPYNSGYTLYQLPPEAPALAVGQEYWWQVVVNCEPSRPSKAIAQDLAIERVSPPATLSYELSTAITAEEKAIVYGQAGLWYDAIAQVAQAETSQAAAIREGLLSNLATSEISNETIPE